MRLISCDGQQQSPVEGWAVVDLLIVLMLMVVVDRVVIGVDNWGGGGYPIIILPKIL